MNYFKFKVKVLFTAFLTGLSIIACNRANLLDGLQLPITNQILVNIANIQLLDAKTLAEIADGKIKIEKIGADKDKIFTLEGKSILTSEAGFISVGVLRSDLPTATKPLDFVLVLKPTDPTVTYMEHRERFTIIKVGKPQNKTLRLIDKNNLPTGVKVEEKNFTVDASGKTTAPIPLSTNASLPENTTVVLPSGTILKDKSGNPVSGPIVATMMTFDATDPNVASRFPGGLSFTSKDSSGNSLGGGTFTTFGFMNLSMTAGGKEVKSFSEPLDVVMEVSPNIQRVVNETDPPRPTKAGDMLPVWSMNDSTGEWMPETVAVIEADPATGKLKANFKQPHLSWWNMADPPCTTLLDWFIQVFFYKRRIPFVPCTVAKTCEDAYVTMRTPAYVSSSFYTEISNATNPNMPVKNDKLEYRNGTVKGISGYLDAGKTDKKTKYIFKIFDKESWDGGQPIHTTTAVIPCNQPTLEMANVSFPQSVTVNVDFTMTCKDNATPIEPTVTLWYKEPHATRWNNLGDIENGGGGTTGLLIAGRPYQFAIRHGKLNFSTNQLDDVYQDGVKVDAITIPINLPNEIRIRLVHAAWNLNQTVVLTKENSERTYKIEMNFIASDELCARYRRYF